MMDGNEEKRSMWWTVAGVVLSSAASLGIGYRLGTRERPCACKAKLPGSGSEAIGGGGGNGNGNGGKSS